MVRNKPQRRNDDRGRNGYGDDRNHHGFRRSPPRFAPSRDRSYRDSDNWRPGDGRRPDSNSRPYSDDRRGGGADSYRPHVPQGDFTFRMDKPAGISNYVPNGQPPQRRPPRRDGRGGGPRRPGRPRWQPPPHPSERALISGVTTGLPEESVHTGEGAKFRDLDELSDDDELDMDISSRSSLSDTEEPSKKRVRTAEADESANAAPKWSNPDPYTALPCPDEATRKKRDVVKLIRKARLEDNSNKPLVSTEAEDFLSFDLSDEEGEDESDIKVIKASELPPPPPPPSELPPPPPPPPASVNNNIEPLGRGIHSLPNKPAAPQDRSDPLGSRKRTHDDEIIQPPNYKQFKKPNMRPSKGTLVPNWTPKPNEEPCPWATIDHSATTNMAFRLHKEVMDFYEFVKPCDFEQTIRNNLVENLKKAMKRDDRNFANAQLFPFGSFMSGLYLPTADMDLVVCSASFMRGGPPTYLSAKSWLYKFRKFLVAQRIAEQDSIEVIAHARIPLVKFIDRVTGLRVDVSFENLGGVKAIDTFLRWKEEYPAMPILVTVIKHFLLMRGLNEPVNGGLGGFSVICLVVSMLQLMPQVQSRSLVPEHHLGEMLLEFFELYGRNFDYEVNAISLTSPIGYIRKSQVSSFTYKKTDRLSIIDPNNPANDISGSSSNTEGVLSRFHDAYLTLRDRMQQVGNDPKCGGILDVLFKGDYSSFRMQRTFLQHIYEKRG
ncbi:hypothetical protein ACSS6W_002912 [Trichoderma asperelloides]|uniref:polynucleotide adenylyltransferase n=1 Tax=Trichoderma asperellum TaxID=101201 RepID=A0A6V8QQZ6_TRIAP|nr:hypothetical protein LI328DRAFT_137580 [Trichoderma asperelloides]GFP54994.1 poly(A) RNA polymerase protein 1 [Trichoderma asperellum]